MDDAQHLLPVCAPAKFPAVDGSPAAWLLSAFLSGRSEQTMRAYRKDLADFAVFMGSQGMDQAASALLAGSHGEANAMALAYRAHLIKRQLAANTVNRRLAA